MSSQARQLAANFQSALTNPGGTFEVTVHDHEFPTQAFTDAEATLFETQFNDLISDVDSSVITSFLLQRQEAIAKVATFAKQEIDGKVFGGVNAGDNQIGFDILRPGQIRADPANGNAENDWYFDPGTTGWVDWIGDGTAANNYSVGEDQVAVVLGFIDQDVSTEISGLDVQQFGRNMDMLPHDLNDVRLMDNKNEIMFQSLPTLVAQDNDDIHIRLRADRDKESQPRLLGLTFGLGAFLNTQDY